MMSAVYQEGYLLTFDKIALPSVFLVKSQTGRIISLQGEIYPTEQKWTS